MVWLAKYTGSAHVGFRGNSIGTVLRATVMGTGLAVVPCFMAAGEPSPLRIAANLAVTAGSSWCFTPEPGQPRIRAVVEFLAEMTREKVAVLGGTQ